MTSTAVPSPISVSTSEAWDSDGAGEWSTFIVDVGTPPQAARVLISTASDETWVVVSAGCPDTYGDNCADERGMIFGPENSTSWMNLPQQDLYQLDLELNLGYTGNGMYGHDAVSLGYPGSGGPTVPNQIVAGIASPDFWLGSFGLDPAPSNFTSLNDPQPSFLWTLNNTRAIPSTSWGYSAGASYRYDKVQGSLTLGGYDASRFSSQNLTIPFYTDTARKFIADLTAITYIPTGVSTITSSITLMSETISICDRFQAAFGLQWNDTSGIYTINDTMHTSLKSMNPNITFTLSNTGGETLDIVLPYAAFDLTASFSVVGNGTKPNYFPLRRAANDTQYTLGRVFLQEAYLIADYEREEFTLAQCEWPPTFTQDLVPILLPSAHATTSLNSTAPLLAYSSKHPIPTAAIAGGVAGGLVLALLALLLVYLFKYKPRHKKPTSEHLSPEDAISNPSPTTPHSNEELEKAELEAQEGFVELPDPRDEKREMLVIEKSGELDTFVPVGSELESTHVWEMAAREPVGSEMSTPIEEKGVERSPESGMVSPLSGNGSGIVSPLTPRS